MIYAQTITRVRPGERTSRGGDVVHDWSTATEDEVTNLSVQPNYQRESADVEGVLAITGYRIISEPGTVPDLRHTDRVQYRGDLYEVDGEVAFWPDPNGRDHIEFTVVRYSGG